MTDRTTRWVVAVVDLEDEGAPPGGLFGPFFAREKAVAEAERWNTAPAPEGWLAVVWRMGGLDALRRFRPEE